MWDKILEIVLSAVIAGIFTLISDRMKSARVSATGSSSAQSIPAPQQSLNNELSAASTYASSPNFATVIKHVGILQLCLNLIGLLVGFTVALAGGDQNTALVILLIIGTILLAIGFWISGSLVDRRIRWMHLVYVAIGLLIVTLLMNSLILQQPITGYSLLVGAAQTFSAMIIAGVLLTAVKRD